MTMSISIITALNQHRFDMPSNSPNAEVAKTAVEVAGAMLSGLSNAVTVLLVLLGLAVVVIIGLIVWVLVLIF